MTQIVKLFTDTPIWGTGTLMPVGNIFGIYWEKSCADVKSVMPNFALQFKVFDTGKSLHDPRYRRLMKMGKDKFMDGKYFGNSGKCYIPIFMH